MKETSKVRIFQEILILLFEQVEIHLHAAHLSIHI